jgi:hypothetical protein
MAPTALCSIVSSGTGQVFASEQVFAGDFVGSWSAHPGKLG